MSYCRGVTPFVGSARLATKGDLRSRGGSGMYTVKVTDARTFLAHCRWECCQENGFCCGCCSKGTELCQPR